MTVPFVMSAGFVAAGLTMGAWSLVVIGALGGIATMVAMVRER